MLEGHSFVKDHVFSLNALALYFNLPGKEAAERLGICTTSFRKACRRCGIKRWPFRKYKSTTDKIQRLEDALRVNPGDPPTMKRLDELRLKLDAILRGEMQGDSEDEDDLEPPSPPPPPPNKPNDLQLQIGIHPYVPSSVPITARTNQDATTTTLKHLIPQHQMLDCTQRATSEPRPRVSTTTTTTTTTAAAAATDHFNRQMVARESASTFVERAKALTEELTATTLAINEGVKEELKRARTEREEEARRVKHRVIAEVEVLRAEASALEERVAYLKKEENRLVAGRASFGSRVLLNVGGVHYTTSVATLTRYEGSRLAAMFSGRMRVQTEDDGRVFIDRNGANFSHVLDLLRDGALDVALTPQLTRDLEYFGLMHVVESATAPPSRMRIPQISTLCNDM